MSRGRGPGRRVGAAGAAVLLAVQDADVSDRIDQTVREVLSRPPYAANPNPVERAVQWLLDRLAGLGVSESGLDVLAWVVRGIVWAVVVGVVLLVLWVVVRRLGPDALRRRGRGPATTVAVDAADRTASDWLAEARDADRRGDHRAAVRGAYRAVVAHLVVVEAVPASVGATVGAHRAALRHADVVAEVQARGFDDASDVFERVWYAGATADARDARVVLAAADDLGVGR